MLLSILLFLMSHLKENKKQNNGIQGKIHNR